MSTIKILIALVVIDVLISINNHFKIKKMALSQSELAQELRNLKAQNEKSRVEVLAKIKTLEDAIANQGNTSPEVDEALADLKTSIQTDDDLNPDAEPPVE